MKTIWNYICDRVNETPQKTAISYKQNDTVIHVTFSQFKEDIAALAAHFQGAGQRRKKIVLMSENTYSFLVAAFGIMASDNILIPLDARMNQESIDEITARVQPDQILRCSDIPQIIEKNTPASGLTSDPSDTAMIMFTSGSTGVSKGVCLTQNNLIADAVSSVEHALISADSFRNLICLPMHHIFCFAVDVMWVVIKGCPLALNTSVIRIKDELREFDCSRVCMVPMMAEVLLTALDMEARNHPETDRNLIRKTVLGEHFRRIILGGAFIEPKLREGLLSYGIEVICGYGMTEATGPVSSEEGAGARAGSVGDILPCNEVKIIDNEICIRGTNVMQGYYHDEQTTAEHLQDGWLKTGDYGYIKDHYLYITGKKKNLIITSNGENVSPEELEKYLHESPMIREVICFQKDDQIQAVIYPDMETFNQETLDAWVKSVNQRLPMYKQIRKYTVTEKELEKTSSMKIKRESYYFGA